MRSCYAFGLLALATLGGCSGANSSNGPRVLQASELSSGPNMSGRQLRILTYNVIVDVVDSRRLPALLALLGSSDADVIALQEVNPWFMKELNRQPWITRYYSTWSDPTQRPPGGLLILSRHWIDRVRAQRVPSLEGRVVLLASLRVPGGLQGDEKIDVVNVHLESPLSMGRLRRMQLQMAGRLVQTAGHAVVLGDFNFGDDAQPESGAIPETLTDLWRSLRGSEAGLTWSPGENELARRRSYIGEGSRRLDRVLLRSSSWRATSIDMIGNEPIVPGSKRLFPSDHFGLLAVIER